MNIKLNKRKVYLDVKLIWAQIALMLIKIIYGVKEALSSVTDLIFDMTMDKENIDEY